MLFLRVFIFKPTERAYVLLKSSTGDFQSNPPFERSACIYVTISENFGNFQFFKPFFKKLEYRFSVERTKIKKISFQYKSAISEANVKTNRMVTRKCEYP